MAPPNLKNSIDTLEEIKTQNTLIIQQNIQIISQNSDVLVGLNDLLSETKEVKRINDDQLTELKKPKN